MSSEYLPSWASFSQTWWNQSLPACGLVEVQQDQLWRVPDPLWHRMQRPAELSRSDPSCGGGGCLCGSLLSRESSKCTPAGPPHLRHMSSSCAFSTAHVTRTGGSRRCMLALCPWERSSALSQGAECDSAYCPFLYDSCHRCLHQEIFFHFIKSSVTKTLLCLPINYSILYVPASKYGQTYRYGLSRSSAMAPVPLSVSTRAFSSGLMTMDERSRRGACVARTCSGITLIDIWAIFYTLILIIEIHNEGWSYFLPRFVINRLFFTRDCVRLEEGRHVFTLK